MRNRIVQLAGALLVGAWVVIAGCSSPSPLKVPEQDGVSLRQNVVTWTTDEPTMGSVRFGDKSGQYDRVAYPPAAGREDKAFVTEHEVPLISPVAGREIYLQVLDRTEDGRTKVGDEMKFTMGTRPANAPLLVWTMIDVGFGDSHLLTMPTTGKRILIDSGERRDWPNVDTFLKTAGVKRIDVALGTHIHADHIGGFVGESYTLNDGILGSYEVGRFLDSPNKSASRYAYGELLRTVAAHGIVLDTVRVGDTSGNDPDLAWDPTVSVSVLNSGYGRSIGGAKAGDYLNNDSIVIQLAYGDVKFVMGGDAEAPVEQELLQERGQALESEVLKIHHHGMDDTSTPEFLDTVNPRVGLIPIATYESFFGTLPTTTVLRHMEDRNIDIYACDRAEPLGIQMTGDDGVNITVTSDGRSYELYVQPSQSVHYAGGNEY